MPQMPTADDEDMQCAVAGHLNEIGDEFGCERMTGENNELYGSRLLDYLEEMIGELKACQDSVRELMT